MLAMMIRILLFLTLTLLLVILVVMIIMMLMRMTPMRRRRSPYFVAGGGMLGILLGGWWWWWCRGRGVVFVVGVRRRWLTTTQSLDRRPRGPSRRHDCFMFRSIFGCCWCYFVVVERMRLRMMLWWMVPLLFRLPVARSSERRPGRNRDHLELFNSKLSTGTSS